MTIGLHKNYVIITGASGFIGRWLAAELTRQGVGVLALVRNGPARVAELRDWVESHGGRAAHVDALHFDLDADDLGLDAVGVERVRGATAVYHLAARFTFGLDRVTARRANVTASERLVELCADAPRLKRFVHLSGYRTTGTPASRLEVDDTDQLDAFYATHGAYEASKIEAHERVRRAAARVGVPLTRISPAAVIGDSRTGETTQLTGLGETIERLMHGRLPALPGGADTLVPLLAVDTLASLLAALPDDPDSAGQHYVALDPDTPPLAKLVARIARRIGVTPPRVSVPVSVLSRLPSALTSVTSEELSFVSDDRYDAQPFLTLLERLGLELPPIGATVDVWVDYLVDTDGLKSKPRGRSFSASGRRVFASGDRAAPQAVLLHGVLLNERSWQPLVDRLRVQHLALDLPGFGRSADSTATPGEWTRAALDGTRSRPVIVGHSLGSAYAIDYALEHADRVQGVILVSPFFLQARPSWLLRRAEVMAPALRFGPRTKLAAVLDGTLDDARTDALELLRRPSVACANARGLSWAARLDVRRDYQQRLAQLQVPVMLIVGERDPLIVDPPANVSIERVAGAGHYPQLTHPARVAELVGRTMPRPPTVVLTDDEHPTLGARPEAR